ncbi:CLD20 protein, partial [Dryoscopus gambensis]|nr:CLD20 protein [Dryoscopus gambensis]
MASASLQFFAFILALFGVFGDIAATLLPNWKVNADVGSNIITAITQMQGLWMDCTWYTFGICITTVGMKCTKLGGDTDSKNHACFAGGVCFILAGIFGLVPTCWYTREIISNFLDQTIPESSKHEPGGAVYTGFISAGFLLIAGVIFCSSCFKRQQGAWIYPPNKH